MKTETIFTGGNPDPAICMIWFEKLVVTGTDCSQPWRDLLDAMSHWWTTARARPILEKRSGGFCECGCGGRLDFEKAHPHHVFPRAQYRGPFRDSPANLALILPKCHEAIHGRVGKGIDMERVHRLQAQALKRLPSWFNDTETIARERTPRRRRSTRHETPCRCGCGRAIGARPINGYRHSCWEGQP